jgi:malonyl-CoA/methylmalonyl-CoA synthetase
MTLLVDRVAEHTHGPAIVAGGSAIDYPELARRSRRVASRVLALARVRDLAEARVAFLVPPGTDWAAIVLGIWRAGGVAVPLAVSHPPPELDYVIRDAQAAMVIADAAFAPALEPLARAAGAAFVTAGALQMTASATGKVSDAEANDAPDPIIAADRRALILYTSGTTGRPKGVVFTHDRLAGQTAMLVEAWAWTRADRTLLVLPLHHVHGIVNVVACALWSGAVCEIHPAFEAAAAWSRLGSGEISVFTAVPTVYHRLIAAFDAATDAEREQWSAGCRQARLMMSGSAALPVALLERWRDISGHVLLERYGMTEVGMALANPLAGPRHPGRVGAPLPGVDIRLVDATGGAVAPGTPGEIELRGPGVFLEYWRRPDATRQAFRDGWFRTGDVAVAEAGVYRLLGRADIDIIKTGGFKVSALEIEDVLRLHPAVADCAVVGVADPEWGERVCAAVEAAPDAVPDREALQEWARSRLAPYKIPRAVRVVPSLPRNAMGKVVKPAVAALFRDPPQ